MDSILVDSSMCQKVWEECSKVDTYCGCIGTPTTLMWIIIIIVIGIIYFIINSWIVKQ